MASIGVKALRDNLSECLRRVRRGEQVVVTDRGRPVATLSAPRGSDEARRVLELVKAGHGSWTGGKPRGLDDAPPVTGRTAAQTVVEDRR